MLRLVLVSAAVVWLGAIDGRGAIAVKQDRSTDNRLGEFPGARLAFEGHGSGYGARGSQFQLSVSPAEAVIRYTAGFGDVDQWFRVEEFRLELIGAARIPAESATGARFDTVHFRRVYPGVDLEFGGTPRRLEYRFSAARDADAGSIRIRMRGLDPVRVAADGSLQARTPLGEIHVHIPSMRDPFDGELRRLDGRYVLVGQGIAEFRPAR